MPVCSKCSGKGHVFYEEDGRNVKDACYHCASTGEVDSETHWHDRLSRLASTLAYAQVTEERKARDTDPSYDGEGWDFCAAEEMLTGEEYFKIKVWDAEERIAKRLSEMSATDQILLVRWNEEPPVKVQVATIKPQKIMIVGISPHYEIQDDIPF